MAGQEQESDLEKRLRDLTDRAGTLADDSLRKELLAEIQKVRDSIGPKNPSYVSVKPESFDELYRLIRVETISEEMSFNKIELKEVKISQVRRGFAFIPKETFLRRNDPICYDDAHQQIHLDKLLVRFRERAKQLAVKNRADVVYVNETALKYTGGLESASTVRYLEGSAYYLLTGTAEFFVLKAR